ncbi:hypothetical protein F5Y00DRAFT_59571 [Daldinia vernicosa]|uniref:uncharacterized protein n=1 Tax=Daldinia vernicosa TaxID=114800 RepID=UPI0020078E9A|nr:uncharacterized protein F5Y00DRAFT_59571 [Daldinia vernicosa]KAI0853763.1 hypothetical protein F5Y00DRAFT_59571 [Daldinia vernicosa]
MRVRVLCWRLTCRYPVLIINTISHNTYITSWYHLMSSVAFKIPTNQPGFDANMQFIGFRGYVSLCWSFYLFPTPVSIPTLLSHTLRS